MKAKEAEGKKGEGSSRATLTLVERTVNQLHAVTTGIPGRAVQARPATGRFLQRRPARYQKAARGTMMPPGRIATPERRPTPAPAVSWRKSWTGTGVPAAL